MTCAPSSDGTQDLMEPAGDQATMHPSPGSPAARYRFSIPVLASSAPSASVATFFCSRKCSKRWRRPSMAAAGAGQAAQARPQPRAPAPPRTHHFCHPRTARPRPRPAAFGPGPWLRPRPPVLANGRAGRTKEVGPAPSPRPHGPLARVEAGAAARRARRGRGARLLACSLVKRVWQDTDWTRGRLLTESD